MKASKTKSDMVLRPAREADVAALAAMWHDGWHVGHAGCVPEALVRYRDAASFAVRVRASLETFHVAEEDGQLIGFIRVKGDALDQFYVAPAAIGQGAAGRLMAAAEALMRGMAIRDAHLIAAEGNVRAIRFYEKQGWRNTGTVLAPVETSDGPFEMAVVRFEKTLA